MAGFAEMWAHLRRMIGGDAAAEADIGGYLPVARDDETLPAPVFAAEMKAIAARRAELGIVSTGAAADAQPSTSLGLVGLALSGGGIRSATFNLGVVQALAKHDLFSRVDYLSTVSGGGYLGSAISSVAAAAPPPEDVDIVLTGLPETARLTQGTRQDDGSWRLSRPHLDDLALILPPHPAAADFIIEGHAEAADDPAVTLDDLAVSLRPKETADGSLDVSVDRHGGGLRVRSAPSQEVRSLALGVRCEAGPFRHRPGRSESEALRHLRDSSNYLVPKRFLAGLRLPGLFLRGLLVNMTIVLPLVLLTVLCTLWMVGGIVREALETGEVQVDFAQDETSVWLDRTADSAVYRLDLAAGAAAAAAARIGPLPDHVAIIKPPFGLEINGRAVTEGKILVFPIDRYPALAISHSGASAERPPLTLRYWKETTAHDLEPATDPITDLHDLVFTWLRLGLMVMLIALTLLPVIQRFSNLGAWTNWRVRDYATRWVAGGAILAGLVIAGAVTQPLAIFYFHQFGDTTIHGLGDLSEVATLAWAAATAIGALFSGTLAERASGLIGRLGLHLLGLMGPVIIWLLYLNFCRWALVPHTAPVWLDQVATELGLALVNWNIDGATGDGPVSLILGMMAGFIAALADALRQLLSWASDETAWLTHSAEVALLYGVAVLVITLATQLFYDVNATSFHRFYRDRLSRAYLIDIWRRDRDGRARHNDEQKLSELDCRRAPYHIINTTLNVQRSRHANMRGRNGAFFIMSREYTGGQLTGYRRTRTMEALHPALDLATAMAISGAAAAPNMGRNTVRGLTFALTLLNIRLGYWLPHPRAFSAPVYGWPVAGPALRLLMRLVVRVTPWHLIREMAGNLDETGWNINLTDGGHLENLGLHELLRRRCRIIIACDAEADPVMKFQGLADAIRFARMDLGINIEIDIDPIRPDPATGLSQAHCAVGRINYGNGESGYLFYVKSSLTGDEDVYIEKYKAEEITFPNQTTADQFFDEEQFEAYRALGFHAAESVLGRHLTVGRDDGIEDIAQKLQDLQGQPLM